MPQQFHKWLFGCFVMTLTTNHLAAQAVLEPPFGLHWGDSPEKLIAWASRQSLNVTISLSGSHPALKILKIQPDKGFLPETEASALEVRFIRGRLYELTIQYFDGTATAGEMETRFETLRRQTTLNHGSLLTNQQQRVVVNQFVTRTVSFHKESMKGVFLLLTFTEEEDLLRKSKESRFSLVYQNDNYKKQWTDR